VICAKKVVKPTTNFLEQIADHRGYCRKMGSGYWYFNGGGILPDEGLKEYG
jgi:hypothetical protein